RAGRSRRRHLRQSAQRGAGGDHRRDPERRDRRSRSRARPAARDCACARAGARGRRRRHRREGPRAGPGAGRPHDPVRRPRGRARDAEAARSGGVIQLALDEVAALCAGSLEPAPGATRITGVKIDSRLVEPGDLFVAVGGGTEFLADARGHGAAATLVPVDAFAALAALGAAVRERSHAKVVAITGSTGKTSTKDILAALCRPHARAIAAHASFNNEIGTPLTLCRLEADTEVCILELAMRGFGQIAELAAIARPQIGAITNVGPVHLELVETVEGVARAKAELLQALPRGGTAIVPAAARELEPYLALEGVDVVRVGADGDVRLVGLTAGRRTTRLEVELLDERLEVELNFTALHHVDNALVALVAYRALGLPL